MLVANLSVTYRTEPAVLWNSGSAIRAHAGVKRATHPVVPRLAIGCALPNLPDCKHGNGQQYRDYDQRMIRSQVVAPLVTVQSALRSVANKSPITVRQAVAL